MKILHNNTSSFVVPNTGFAKSLSNMHIIIHHLQDVFQQLPDDLFAS